MKSNILNDYILQDKIGYGSFGKVYRVKKRKTNEIYAAKISINELNTENQDLFMDISREIDILSRLNHPSVLKFILFSPINFKMKAMPVIITEFLPNGSLSRALEHDRIYPENQYLDQTHKLIIIYGIASAMSYLHSHNIIHRDLKPDNILLDEFFFPKVADFGLSKSDSKNQESILMKTVSGTFKGTPIYISPEIWSNYQYSKSSDVYAFAFIVYEIMTLKKPFSELNIYSLAKIIRNAERPSFEKNIPECYKYLIERCWSENPSNRPTFDQILLELKNDQNYTEKVNKGQFLNYIKMIDEYKVTFNSSKSIVSFQNFKKNYSFEKLNRFVFEIKHPQIYGLFENSNESIQKTIIEAESGNIEMQFEVGRNLIEGRNDFPFDIKNGLIYIKELMNKGNKESFAYYIKMLIKGNIIPKNHAKARKLLDKKLIEYVGLYYFLYGKLYKNEKKYVEAKNCFKQSIKENNIDSYYEYAELLRKGFCQPEYQEEMSKYYKEAIDKGDAKSMFKYGIFLIESDIDKKNQEEGNKLIKLSAEKGYSKALYYLGSNLNVESIKYLKKAAYEGHTESMYKYGLLLLQKEKNKKESMEYLKKASDKGCIESMYEYGYSLAFVISYKPKEAIRYVKIAADQNHPDAIAIYARLKFILKDDYNEVIKYYKRAIDKGSLTAMHNYASMLQNGEGIEINYEEAIKYYKMAIDKGNHNSISSYAYMLSKGLGI